MDEGYPIMLHLAGRSCVIVGGGTVGTRKAFGLLSTGAQITVISPKLDSALEKLAEEQAISIRRQIYTVGMLRELQPLLVFAAVNDSAVNKRVAEESHALGALVDITDSNCECDFTGMSTLRRGSITVALSSGGASPALTRHLREQVAQVIGEEYAILAMWLADARPRVGGMAITQPERAVIWHRILESPILHDLRRGDEEVARSQFDRLLQEAVGNQK